MRRISYTIISLIMVFSMTTITAFAKPDWPIDTGVQSEVGIVTDMGSGAVLLAQNIREQKIPASITRLLTALVVIENTSDLDTPITFSHGTIYDMESGIGNEFSLEEGDVLGVRQCLYTMLLQSSNQSVSALAEYVAESRQAFMDMMNQQIAELGCNESHLISPSGLNDDTRRITVYDIAIITRACFQNPTVLEVTSARTSIIPVTANNPNGRTFSIEHKVLLSDDSSYCPGAITGKTGWTSQAGQTLVTYARRGGRGQIAVTLKSTQKTHYLDTEAVLDFCSAKFKNADIADNGIEYVTGDTPVTIAGETCDPSELSIGSGTVITIPNNAQFTDADKTLEADLPEDHPQGVMARLVYTCNEWRVGDAWVHSSKVQAVNATPSEPGKDTPQESQPEKDGQGGKTDLKLPRAVLTGGGTVLALALIADNGAFWFKRRQAAEREHQRILREKHRRRLMDMGYTKEDFERLLNEQRRRHDMRWFSPCCR